MSARSSHPQARRIARLKWTAFGICVALAAIGALVGLRGPMLHTYEYQEDLYLSLDGSATLYLSSSLPALVALHGLDLPTSPKAPLDRAKLRTAFAGPGVSVSSISAWRRHGRRFVTIRIDATEVTKLAGVPPFSTSRFEFGRVGAGYRLREQLGPPSGKPVGDVGWNGSELVGFRWHVPSKIESHNTRKENFLRGNILVWEQPLSKRQSAAPLLMVVEMQAESILHGTLWLFAISVGAALTVVALVLWWVVRKRPEKKTPPRPLAGTER